MTAILAMWNDCRAGREAAYESWYREEHLIERLGVPGFRVGRRYGAHDASRNYLTTYEVDSTDVLISPAYRERLENPTPRTREIMQNDFKNMCRTVCARQDVQGVIRGSWVVTSAWSEDLAYSQVCVDAERLRLHKDVLHSELWVSADDGAGKATTEESLRGSDQKISRCLVLEFTSPDATLECAANLRGVSPQADVGVFSLMCAIREEDLA